MQPHLPAKTGNVKTGVKKAPLLQERGWGEVKPNVGKKNKTTKRCLCNLPSNIIYAFKNDNVHPLAPDYTGTM